MTTVHEPERWVVPVTVSTPGVVDNYIVRVIVPYSAGYMQSTFGDVRFGDAYTGLLYPIWMESYLAGTSASFLVTVPLAAQSTFSMFCGNALLDTFGAATSGFEFFDHFEGTSLDATKWTADSGEFDSSDAEQSTTSLAMTKVMELTVPAGMGAATVSWQGKVGTAPKYYKAQIYVNGSPVGVYYNMELYNTDYRGFVDTISGLIAGDKLQLYIARSSGVSFTVYAKEFRVWYNSGSVTVAGSVATIATLSACTVAIESTLEFSVGDTLSVRMYSVGTVYGGFENITEPLAYDKLYSTSAATSWRTGYPGYKALVEDGEFGVYGGITTEAGRVYGSGLVEDARMLVAASTETISPAGCYLSSWRVLDIKRVGIGVVEYWVDGVLDQRVTSNVPWYNLPIRLSAYSTGVLYADWVGIRSLSAEGSGASLGAYSQNTMFTWRVV